MSVLDTAKDALKDLEYSLPQSKKYWDDAQSKSSQIAQLYQNALLQRDALSQTAANLQLSISSCSLGRGGSNTDNTDISQQDALLANLQSIQQRIEMLSQQLIALQAQKDAAEAEVHTAKDCLDKHSTYLCKIFASLKNNEQQHIHMLQTYRALSAKKFGASAGADGLAQETAALRECLQLQQQALLLAKSVGISLAEDNVERPYLQDDAALPQNRGVTSTSTGSLPAASVGSLPIPPSVGPTVESTSDSLSENGTSTKPYCKGKFFTYQIDPDDGQSQSATNSPPAKKKSILSQLLHVEPIAATSVENYRNGLKQHQSSFSDIYKSHRSVQGRNILNRFHYDPNGYPPDAAHQAAWKQGFQAMPFLVNKSAFQEAATQSGIVAYRTYMAGNNALTGKMTSAEDFKEILKSGDNYRMNGNGAQVYGAGLYVAATKPSPGKNPMKGKSSQLARENSESYAHEEKFSVAQITFAPDCKFGEYNKVLLEFKRLPRTVQENTYGGFGVKGVGAYAIAKGYDGLRISGGDDMGFDYYTLYNRSKLIILDD